MRSETPTNLETRPLPADAAGSFSPTSRLEVLKWSTLAPTGHVLGVGRSGAVYLGSIEGHPAALKTVDPDAKNVGELLEELENEVNAYEKLRPLWGESVPSVYRYGKCDETHCCILTLEYLPGRQLEGSQASEKVKMDTLRALVQIHGLGVVHGEIRLSNIMLADEKPFFVDFGFARLDGTKENQEGEQADLRRMPGL